MNEMQEKVIGRAVELMDHPASELDETFIRRPALGSGVAPFSPEGTFGRTPGLQSFRTGAFLAAAHAGAPVVPLAIRGTRSVLRDGQWLPRRGPIGVVIGSPLWPNGDDWPAAVRLHNTARTEVLHYCGEPDGLRATHRGSRRA